MSEPSYDVLLSGFPGKTARGFLGWSTTVLLKTTSGYALLDTGGAGDRPGLIEALAERNIQPSDIRTVIVSHLHFDHIANAECFRGAEFVLHETELDYFEKHQANDPAIPRYQVEGLLRSPQVSIVSGELDVLPGIRMIRTPGHTAGHVSLVLNVGGQCVVLAQDAVKHRGEMDSGISAGAFDAGIASASIRRIAAMADVIVPGHDAPLFLSKGKVQTCGTLCEEIRNTVTGQFHRMEV
ncbi:MBL fold metallo-hydrolase [Rhizobium sp. GR12]|uniref:MBL fold metallo-hydrolase n=1 Tax=Rhizobium sp. GR12 TaxID=3053925 RepID=UPI002FBD322C